MSAHRQIWAWQRAASNLWLQFEPTCIRTEDSAAVRYVRADIADEMRGALKEFFNLTMPGLSYLNGAELSEIIRVTNLAGDALAKAESQD